MRKSRLSSLVVAMVIATILFAGCTSPTQTSPQIASTNTSSKTASTTTTSVVKTALGVSPSPSASASPTPTSTPTSTPQPSGKIATSINGNPAFLSQTANSIPQGTKVSWAFEVIGQGHILCGNGDTVTVLIDGKSVGQVNPQQPISGSCFATAGFNWTATSGRHTLTVSYAGNNTYQSSELTAEISVT